MVQEQISPGYSWKDIAVVIAVLLLAAAVRLPQLDRHGYSMDEMWAVEAASGRGSLHERLPVNQIGPATELFRLTGAPPWWDVWTHMEHTHPPLYWILLRWWENLFGTSDWTDRVFSVVASLIAVVIFYDVVRLLNGKTVAFWAVILMALATPQVDLARTARNYAMLTAVALAMVDAVARIEKLGFSRRRWIGLLAATLATLLTHYFCIGAVIGVMCYVVLRFTGELRLRVLTAFLVAGLLFAVVWGPCMWRQRHLFATDDEATLFLSQDQPGHLMHTLDRTLLVPSSLLFPPRLPSRYFSMGAAVFYVLPFVLFSQRPRLLIWGCWLIGTVGVVAGLDATRGTAHLFYPRYTQLAGPAVYVLLPALLLEIKTRRWLGHAVCAAAAIGCALAIPDVYDQWKDISDPGEVIHDLAHPLRTNDLLIFADAGGDRRSAGLQYLLIDRYLSPIPCPVLVMTKAAGPEVNAQIARSDAVYLFGTDKKCENMIPGVLPFEGRWYMGRGLRWRLK